MTVAESEERAQFTLAMRARGINDLSLLRALERAPRALFMPPRFADISGRDIALPIGCGQTSPPPSIVAAMIAALDAEARASRLRNRNRNRILRRAARPACEHDRVARAVPDAGGGGVGEDQGLRTRQCHGALGGRIRASPLGRALRSGHRPRPHRAAGRGVSPPDPPGGVLVAVVAGPDRGEQRIVRLTDTTSGAVEAEDMGPARGMRPLEHGLARAL